LAWKGYRNREENGMEEFPFKVEWNENGVETGKKTEWMDFSFNKLNGTVRMWKREEIGIEKSSIRGFEWSGNGEPGGGQIRSGRLWKEESTRTDGGGGIL
jgi:hypothetical protein